MFAIVGILSGLGSPSGVVGNMLDILVSLNSGYAITYTFGLMLMGKA